MSNTQRSMIVSATTPRLAMHIALLLALVSVALVPVAVRHAPAAAAAQSHRPNIVWITTDDERVEDLRWMPYTRRLIGGHGVNFLDGLTPHPLCCPTRAEWMTGQYAQNNGVYYNKGTHGGYPSLIRPGNTLGRWLHDAGYQTAMVGKYLNQYTADRASKRGWDHWNPSLRKVFAYFGTTLYNDGRPKVFDQHIDDVVSSFAVRYIREFAQRRAPFMVWASALAPHVRTYRHVATPPLPARRFIGMFAGTPNPSEDKPSYGVPIVDGPVGHADLSKQAREHVARIESLQAIDEGVRRIVRVLRRTGELSNTYVFFTSDNGYLLGEHGFDQKNYIYEEAVRVPFLVRTPHGTESTSQVPVTAVDMAPTVADLTGATPQREVDGASFAPLLRGATVDWRDTQLLLTASFSNNNDPAWLVRGVRTARWTYGVNEETGLRELYDRVDDPWEMRNVAGRPAYQPVVAELQARFEALRSCSGSGCRSSFGPVPGPTQQ